MIIDINKPFVRGDLREDGFLFWCYNRGKEIWYSPSTFEKEKIRCRNRDKERVKSPKGRAQKLIRAAMSRSDVVTISVDWVAEKIAVGVCELTGLPFDLSPASNTRQNPYSPSLDRKDNENKDYTPENTRVVLTAVNMAINEHGLETMLPIFKQLAKL